MKGQIIERTFVKKDGSLRAMRFIRLKDLTPDDRQSLGIPLPSERPAPKLEAGSELVWDVQAEGFRVFNWNAVVEEEAA